MTTHKPICVCVEVCISIESTAERCELLRNVRIKLNQKGIARAKELLNHQWFQKPVWQAEIKRMLASGLKYELDALANKDFQYLTKKYLPRKLKEKDWLD